MRTHLPTTTHQARGDSSTSSGAPGKRSLTDGVSSSAGAPLPSGARDQFEASLGTDLSGVRVHDGAESAGAAADLGARAFTVGNDIHFGAGNYDPGSQGGMFLLAHEVAHTAQQGGVAARPQAKLEVSAPGDSAEVEADAAAHAMVTGAPATVSPVGPAIHRTVETGGGDDLTGAPPPAVGNGGGAAPGPRPTLRVGSRGDDVRHLQEKLAAAGHACTADGAFGPQTRTAVIAYQRANALTPDGIVGPLTWGSIDGGGATATPPAGGGGTAETPPTGGGGTQTPATDDTAGQTQTTTPATTTTHTTETGNGETPQTGSGSSVRDAIVAAARAKIGTVFSNTPGETDETGQKTRQGWQTLQAIFDVAYPSFPKPIIKHIKYGVNNGESHNPNGLVSWCGIFATYAVITGGGNAGTWTSGNRVSSMKKITNDPKPGDVGYFEHRQHHCIIASVNGDQIETIDGNSYDADAGGNGAITSTMRSRSSFQGFFKQVDD
jgi:peptidoglycan hydrolase-like protein with peptidoglycan-binding domain